MNKLHLLFLFLLISPQAFSIKSVDTIRIEHERLIKSIGTNIYLLKDETNTLMLDDVIESDEFIKSTKNGTKKIKISGMNIIKSIVKKMLIR